MTTSAGRGEQGWTELTYDASIDYRHEEAELSAKALAMLRRLVKGEKAGPIGAVA